ncbi:hypothetical protein [Streptomyces sp. NBC_00872]|uniref:hypothetical protein n=1 Tax=Streptomyces sp. NBC_00872 TaxID=2903686 RepID=UPI003869CFD7|nr:hypothetical protein OG214_18655 [Streptomyces sp. NBC_00872]
MTAYDVARRLPAIDDLRNLCRSLAVLDAVLSPDREYRYRYYSFDSAWADGETATPEMVSSLNAQTDLSDLAGEIHEIGCPAPVRDSA